MDDGDFTLNLVSDGPSPAAKRQKSKGRGNNKKKKKQKVASKSTSGGVSGGAARPTKPHQTKTRQQPPPKKQNSQNHSNTANGSSPQQSDATKKKYSPGVKESSVGEKRPREENVVSFSDDEDRPSSVTKGTMIGENGKAKAFKIVRPSKAPKLLTDEQVTNIDSKDSRVASHRVRDEASIFTSQALADVEISDRLKSSLSEFFQVKKLTHIQGMVIPQVLSGRDVLLRAETGSGKTLSYAIPLLEQMIHTEPKITRADGTLAIILAPTRELCIQIDVVLNKLTHYCRWIVPGAVMGGEKKKSEKARIRKGINILCATPGRLLDHLRTTSSLKRDRLSWLILDEADRLLDMGFEKDLMEILRILSLDVTCYRQNVLVSATLTKKISTLAESSLNNPIYVGFNKAGGTDKKVAKPAVMEDLEGEEFEAIVEEEEKEKYSVPEGLTQYYRLVPLKWRLVNLACFLRQKISAVQSKSKIIVFVSSIASVEFHHRLLSYSASPESLGDDEADAQPLIACKIFKLHGNMTQKERTETFFSFTKVPTGVLICTDVAARGLDIPAVDWIVQYDPAGATEEYLHRVGRTARLGQVGKALLFLQPNESGYIQALTSHNLQMKEMTAEPVAQTQIRMQRYFEDQNDTSRDLADMARDAYFSFIRAYRTYPIQVREYFNFKKLHFGHLATSFALRDPPKSIVNTQAKVLKEKQKREKADFAEKFQITENMSKTKKLSVRKQVASARLRALKSGGKPEKLNLKARMSEYGGGLSFKKK